MTLKASQKLLDGGTPPTKDMKRIFLENLRIAAAIHASDKETINGKRILGTGQSIIADAHNLNTRKMDKPGAYSKEILGLSVETSMRPAPPTVSPMDATSTVMDLMTKENVGSIVVMEGSQASQES